MNDDCTICLQPMKCCEPISKLACQHSYHKKCVEMWIKYSEEDHLWQCPLCRNYYINPPKPKPPPTPAKKKEARVVRIAYAICSKDWILIFEERPIWPLIGM